MIKSSHYVPLDSKKLIEAAVKNVADKSLGRHGGAASSAHQAADLEQAVRDRQLEDEIERIKSEARAEAATIVQQANAEAAELREAAEQQLAEWLAARQQEIEEELAQTIQETQEQAYRDGLHRGELDAKERWSELVASAERVLQEAHEAKRELIAEAEPFLLELSVQFAEKVIGRQLTLEPEWMIQMIRTVLSRERRKGLVTLCVSPDQYAFIKDARHELQAVLDSQAELQILPDASVNGHGCVVRTDFGSLDARIDAQLGEIKQAMLQVLAAEQGEIDR